MLTALGSGPSDLYAALPIAGDTIGVRKTSAGQTVYYAVLDEPLRDRTADPDQYTAARCGEDSAGRFVWVSDVVFRPITPGAVPHFGMKGFPIELAYVLDPELRRSDGVIAADALDFAASGFIDDIDTDAAPQPAALNASDVDVDFDDHAPAVSDPAVKPPHAPPRRPLIDLPPLADELDVDQELLTVPAAAPVTGVERRSLIDLPPLADELDEDGDLSFTGAVPIRTPVPVAPPAQESGPQRPPAVVPRAAEPFPVEGSEPVPERSSSPPATARPEPPVAATRRTGVAVDGADAAPTEDLAAGAAARPDATRLALLAAVGLLSAGLVGLIFWAITGRDSGETPSASTSSVSEAPTSSAAPAPPSPSLIAPAVPPDAVLRLVPVGYPDKTCTPDPAVPLGALAAVTCGPNIDPGGPRVGRYTLVADLPAMQTQFAEITSSTRQQICPGNIQSPGPWRHNATPDQVAGQLYCGLRGDGTPIIAWTDDARLLLSVVDAPPGGEAAAFKWWSSHS